MAPKKTSKRNEHEPESNEEESRDAPRPIAMPATSAEERTAANIERTRRRNQKRLETADTSDQTTLGEFREKGKTGREEEERGGKREHLGPRPSTFFNQAVRGPDDSFAPPPWLLNEIRNVAVSEPPVPSRAPVTFENSDEAAEKNEAVLRAVGCDIQKLIENNSGTTLGYGCEFRPIKQLKPLIGSHPHFADLSRVLKFGMPYVFSSDLGELTKLSELQTLLKRGNHKSALEFPDRVTELLTKDVIHGFAIPIPSRIIEKIPNAAIQPLGLAHQ